MLWSCGFVGHIKRSLPVTGHGYWNSTRTLLQGGRIFYRFSLYFELDSYFYITVVACRKSWDAADQLVDTRLFHSQTCAIVRRLFVLFWHLEYGILILVYFDDYRIEAIQYYFVLLYLSERDYFQLLDVYNLCFTPAFRMAIKQRLFVENVSNWEKIIFGLKLLYT